MDPGKSGVMPPDVYVASLARKRMAVGALCRDGTGRVLLVDPVYRDTWDLPGGAVEAEESPQAAPVGSAFDEEVTDVGQQQGNGGQDEQGGHSRAPVACRGPECQPDHSGHGRHS